MPLYFNRKFVLPIIAFIILISLVFTIWSQSKKNHIEWVKEQISQTGNLATQEFQSIVRSDIARLENLKKRLEFTNGDYYLNWEQDAAMLIEQNASFKFLEWIDSSMIIRKISPLKGNEAALNLDVSKVDYRRDEWIKHSLDSTTNITQWAKLTQGGNAFLVDIPVYFKDRFQGTITAGMDFTAHFNKFATPLKDYSIELRDNKGTLFYEFNPLSKNTSNKDLIFETSFFADVPDRQDWSFKLYPTDKLLLAEPLAFINFALGVGILFSLLISLLIYFYLRAKKETKRALQSNLQLSKANEKLEKERKKAEKASKAKTEFLSNMSHEIRTPLHAILGFIQVLKQRDLDTTDMSYIELMDKSSTNLLSIVNDILEIDKIESGNVILEDVYFNPAKKIQEILDIYKFHFSEKNLYIHSNFKEPYGINVMGDQNKFSQIVINILKNALKFTTLGGIEVDYSEEKIENHLKLDITIEDTGIGIPKNKLSTIFNRFTQIDGSLKKQHEGSGLGLAISKDLAALLGGTISAKSMLNQGTAFKISVLLKIAENQNKFDISETYRNIDLSHLNVLIVDDNKINVIVLKKLLEDLRIHVDVAYNGKIAVEKVQSTTYQLVLMDIHMPEMDGFEATTLIRKQDTDLIIIGLSANVTTQAISKALDCGMNNYLTKPFTKERLYKLLLTYFS
ncbi:signal transduction histidine kinase [Flavobacteriaceae bacterium MAR_2010_72]|nr:signal transduction histidine kinase [Flavobacteriaceae bacterium MAR_2010_72]TVZ58828.1 signal transduction histidine kinase [Flavobacteriaceae bacterium MAR_2010_105]